MSSDGDGKAEDSKVAKIARLALAAGVVWGVFRFIQARREEDALIREYYGDREDFYVPDSEQSGDEQDELSSRSRPDDEMTFAAETKEVVEVFNVREEVIVPEPKQHEPKEKPWLLSLFNPQKLKRDKLLFSPSERTHEIEKGDTLWAISRRYGVSLERLKAANGLDADDIYAGENLVIPKG